MTLAIKRTWLLMLALLVAGISLMPMTHASAQDVDAELTSTIHFVGQLIEISSTDAPTTIIVRENPEGEWVDWTVDVTESTAFGTNIFNESSMNDWLNGDILSIQGTLNENTQVVDAGVIVNKSMNPASYRGLNGWIDSIDIDNSKIMVQWNDVIHTVDLTDRTHMVVGQTNPATLEDFEVGDRIRLRLFQESDFENEARIVFALRRGPHIYQLARTRGFYADLNEIDGDENVMNVTLVVNPHLRDGDVNNLLGIEGEELTVTWDNNTTFVRRFHGKTDEDALSPGDRLFIVGRVNDDGTVSARLVKDNSIWVRGVGHHLGEVQAINLNAKEIEVIRVFDDRDEPVVWTILYDDETSIFVDGFEALVENISVGMELRARGVANFEQKTVDAWRIAVYDENDPFEYHRARINDILEDIEAYDESQEE